MENSLAGWAAGRGSRDRGKPLLCRPSQTMQTPLASPLPPLILEAANHRRAGLWGLALLASQARQEQREGKRLPPGPSSAANTSACRGWDSGGGVYVPLLSLPLTTPCGCQAHARMQDWGAEALLLQLCNSPGGRTQLAPGQSA